jgi:cell division protein FtsZ
MSFKQPHFAGKVIEKPMEISMVENPVLSARLTVVGVGGGGGNAVNNMLETGLQRVKFIAVNTDIQALEKSLAPLRLQLGQNIGRGLGAGANPKIGRAAAMRDRERIKDLLRGSDMVFVIAGMGGGTGTGAAPVVAEVARELGALTVAAVTMPFEFEGRKRMQQAQTGMKELNQAVDTLILIPNTWLRDTAHKGVSFFDLLKKSDGILSEAVRGISDLIVRPGLVNLDFVQARSIMEAMRIVLMGTGRANGEDRSLKAVDKAINSPLLNKRGIGNASVVLMNVTAPLDISIDELEAAYHHARSRVRENARFVWGCVMDDSADCDVRITIFCQPEEADVWIPSLSGVTSMEDVPQLAAVVVPMAGNYH